MTIKALPVDGFPHMSLTACGDADLMEGTITGLRRAGFKVEADWIIPPADATGQQVIAAMSAAFQAAKQDGSASRKLRS